MAAWFNFEHYKSENFNKSRQPPGGNTNDIFDLEERQRQQKLLIYQDKNKKNVAPGNDCQKKCHEMEDIESPRSSRGNLRRSFSDCKISSKEPRERTPPLAPGKENIGTHFKKNMSPRLILNSGEKKMEESEENDDELTPAELQPNHNPITGDGLGSDSLPRSTLEDTTNVAKDEVMQKKEPRRPCIRVRQPPGGKSSIIF